MSVSIPILIQEGFGTGNAGKTYPIPIPSQIGITDGAASFTDGFPPLTRTAISAGGKPPNGQDMDGILYMLSAHMAYINSGGLYLFDATQAAAIGGYGVGALLASTSGNGYWLNTVANNTANPDTAASYAGWYPVNFIGETVLGNTSGTVVVTPEQAAPYVVAFNGNLTGNVTFQLPPWAGKNWVLASYATHNGFQILVETTVAGSSVVVPPGGYAQAQGVFVDSVGNLYSNNVSTAGLAPINSPGLTGTPTTPTAAGSSNTTQIASTAMVQAAIGAAIAGLAPLASPTLSGNPTAPTAAPGTNNALLATTAFVQAAIALATALRAGSNTSGSFTLGGLIVNFGTTFISAAPLTIGFQKPYPTACVANVPVGVTASNGSIPIIGVSNPASSKTSFQVFSSITSGATVNWISIGY